MAGQELEADFWADDLLVHLVTEQRVRSDLSFTFKIKYGLTPSLALPMLNLIRKSSMTPYSVD